MAAPTSIDVSVDASEYSRYEEGRKTITATVVVSGGAPYTAEEVTVELTKARKARNSVAATVTLTFSGSSDPQEAVAEFFLPDIVDQDQIHLVRHGKYFIRATSDTDTNIIGESDDFDISVVTVDKLKSDYLFGIDLSATEIKAPKFQPQEISGISIVETSKTHPLGFDELNYIYHKDALTNSTVSIGSGADGTVDIEAVKGIEGDTGNSWTVEVRVPGGTSPLTVSTTGTQLLVDLSVSSGTPVAVDNTATKVASAISSLNNFEATATGTGASSLTNSEGPFSFSGGTSQVVRKINWGGGPLISLTKSGTFVLVKGLTGPAAGLSGVQNRDYICIKVKSLALLPTENKTEAILIDNKKIDDSTLKSFIDKSIDWVENDYLMTHIEPTNVVTDVDPSTVQFSAGVQAPTPIFTDTDFDFIVSPLTYFLHPHNSSWVQIQFPHPQMLRIDTLFGAIANTRVIDIDLEWIEISQQGGLVQLVPYNQEIAFDFVGLIWVNAIRGAVELPNFWHYNAIVGLRDAPGDIRELISKKAAIDALTIAGMALRPGVGSLSLSRDGVSESVSYINSMEYGMYTGTIKSYKDWIEEHGKELRARYRGPIMRVV